MQASSGTVGPQAVCFSGEDYAGFWRRVAVELVDLFTAGIILIAVTTIIVLAAPANAQSGGVFLVCWAASIYWYFVIVKHSRFNTLGYRLARVRIVDVYGRPPSLSALSLRLLFAVVGPFNIALDIFWIPSDRCKQSLRDKLAHTYVVKANAQPAGPARIVYRQYYLMTMSFTFQEVEPLGSPHAS